MKKITYKSHWADRSISESLDDFVVKKFSPADYGGGIVEDIRAGQGNAADCFARLLEKLFDKGVLSAADVFEIVAGRASDDEVKIE